MTAPPCGLTAFQTSAPNPVTLRIMPLSHRGRETPSPWAIWGPWNHWIWPCRCNCRWDSKFNHAIAGSFLSCYHFVWPANDVMNVQNGQKGSPPCSSRQQHGCCWSRALPCLLQHHCLEHCSLHADPVLPHEAHYFNTWFRVYVLPFLLFCWNLNPACKFLWAEIIPSTLHTLIFCFVK